MKKIKQMSKTPDYCKYCKCCPYCFELKLNQALNDDQNAITVPFGCSAVAIVGAAICALAFATSVANSASIARHKFNDSSVSISASALDAADVAEADADRCGCEFESGCAKFGSSDRDIAADGRVALGRSSVDRNAVTGGCAEDDDDAADGSSRRLRRCR